MSDRTSDADLAAAFDHCGRLARRTGKNFAWSFLTLPRAMRRDMGAVYAFMRVTDDLGDDAAVPVAERRAALDAWRAATVAISEDAPRAAGFNPAAPADVQILAAFADVARRRGIDPRYPLAVIDGVRSDLEHPASPTEPRVLCGTWADLSDYCYHVAGAVGLCCLPVWGVTGDAGDPAVVGPALACGRAFQLTNILRDVAEDAAAGRIYLPAEDLARFDLTAADLAGGGLVPDHDDRFRALMRFEADRARAQYAAARPLSARLSRPGRRILAAMTGIYGGLLDRIERSNFAVYDGRIAVPKWRKIAVVGRALLHP